MRLPIASQRSQGRARQLSPERLVNMYAEQAPQDGKSQIVAHGVPGTTLFADLGDGFIRGMHRMQVDDSLFVVHGLTLYEISTAGVASSKGTIASSGRVGMADNGTQLAIAAGGKGYIWNGSTLTEITDDDFPRAETVDVMDGFFIWNNSTAGQKGQFFISNLLDGTTYDALDFATAERYPDNLRRPFVNFSDLILFGTDSIEMWFNSGNADFPFEPVSGGEIDTGLGATWSPQRVDNTVIFLDHDGIVRMLNGFTPVRISTHAIEYAISQGNWRTTDSQEGAFSYTYTEEGHEFYVLTVPGSGTFVYDAATRLWHERKSADLAVSRMGFHAYHNGKHILGDIYNGKLYEASLETYKENEEEIIAEIICPQIWNETERFIVHKLQLDLETGNEFIESPSSTAYTFDGFTIRSNTFGSSVIHDSVYGEGYFQVVGISSGNTSKNYSDDGVTFSQAPANNSQFRDYRAVSNGATYFLVVGGATGGSAMSASWFDSATGAGTDYSTSAAFPANGVHYADGIYVIVQEQGGISTTTDSDLSSFTFSHKNSPFGTTDIEDVTFFKNEWYFVGGAGKIYKTTDFVTYVAVTSPFSAAETIWRAESNSQYIIISGSSGKIYKSTTGSAWDKIDAGFVDDIRALHFYNGILIAGGDGGLMRFSDASISEWETVDADFGTSDIYSITSGEDRIVVTGADGKTSSSSVSSEDVSDNPLFATPQVMLDISSDTRTYDKTQSWRSFGKKGEYSKRVIWRRLGQHRSFTPKFAISAPVKRAVFSVYADVEPCRG